MVLRIPLKAGDFIDHLGDFGVSRLASMPYINGLLCKSEVVFKYLIGTRSTRTGWGSLPPHRCGSHVQVYTIGTAFVSLLCYMLQCSYAAVKYRRSNWVFVLMERRGERGAGDEEAEREPGNSGGALLIGPFVSGRP